MRRAGCLALLFIVLTVSACGDPEPVKIGYVGGLTGRFGNLGQEGRDGAILAVEEANAADGIDGRLIELLIRDDRQDEATAVAVDRELIESGVAAIVGHMTSSMSVAAVSLMNRAGVLMVSPTTSTNALTGLDDQFFRVYAPNRMEATNLAAHARNDLGLARVSVVYDLSNRAHTENWRDTFGGEFEKLGGKIVSTPFFTSTPSVRFRELAEQIAVVETDGLLILANALDTARLCQHLRNIGFTAPIMVSQWSVTTDILSLGGGAVEGIRFFNTYDRGNTNPRFLAFKEAFIRRFGRDPDFAAIFSYEAVQVVLTGLKDAKDPQDLKRAILARRSFPGLLDGFAFDDFGDVVRDMVLMTVHDGKYEKLR